MGLWVTALWIWFPKYAYLEQRLYIHVHQLFVVQLRSRVNHTRNTNKPEKVARVACALCTSYYYQKVDEIHTSSFSVLVDELFAA